MAGVDVRDQVCMHADSDLPISVNDDMHVHVCIIPCAKRCHFDFV